MELAHICRKTRHFYAQKRVPEWFFKISEVNNEDFFQLFAWRADRKRRFVSGFFKFPNNVNHQTLHQVNPES